MMGSGRYLWDVPRAWDLTKAVYTPIGSQLFNGRVAQWLRHVLYSKIAQDRRFDPCHDQISLFLAPIPSSLLLLSAIITLFASFFGWESGLKVNRLFFSFFRITI